MLCDSHVSDVLQKTKKIKNKKKGVSLITPTPRDPFLPGPRSSAGEPTRAHGRPEPSSRRIRGCVLFVGAHVYYLKGKGKGKLIAGGGGDDREHEHDSLWKTVAFQQLKVFHTLTHPHHGRRDG